MKELIKQIYSVETSSPFPYEDLRQLQSDFAKDFKKNVPNEIINADFSTYMMFIYGLSSGGIIKKLEDPLERYKTKERLNKSFFEWFPKYRFLEAYDFSIYKELYKEWKVIEELRLKLIELIKHRESHK